MAKIAVVTAADEGFAGLARVLLRSLAMLPSRRQFMVVLVDLGLSEDSRRRLAPLADRLESAAPHGFGSHGANAARIPAAWVKPRLPSFAPEADVIIWCDADAWVQDPIAIDRMAAVAARQPIAITAEIDPCYKIHQETAVTHERFRRQEYAAHYDDVTAARLGSRPFLNSGVFAVRRDAPLWHRWVQECDRLVARSGNFMTDQIALNVLLEGEHAMPLLPTRYNWLCNYAHPARLPTDSSWWTPSADPLRIYVLHLAGGRFRQRLAAARATIGPPAVAPFWSELVGDAGTGDPIDSISGW